MEQASVRMITYLTKGSICYIKHPNPRGQMVEHYAIVCNNTPASDKTIVFAVITSVRDNYMISAIQQKHGKKFILLVNPTLFKKLTHLSFINCHRPVLRTLKQLCKEVDSGEAIFYHPGTDNYALINACVTGMLDSDNVSDTQKDIIHECVTALPKEHSSGSTTLSIAGQSANKTSA